MSKALTKQLRYVTCRNTRFKASAAVTRLQLWLTALEKARSERQAYTESCAGLTRPQCLVTRRIEREGSHTRKSVLSQS